MASQGVLCSVEDKHAPGCPKSGLFAAPFFARRRPSDFTGAKYQSGATEKDEGEKGWVSPVGFRYWHENRERCNRKGQQIHLFGLLFGCLDLDGAIRMPILTAVFVIHVTPQQQPREQRISRRDLALLRNQRNSAAIRYRPPERCDCRTARARCQSARCRCVLTHDWLSRGGNAM